MAQINMHVTPDFAAKLSRFMRIRGIKTKSEAIRLAVAECLARAGSARLFDFSRLRGRGVAGPTNPTPRFRSDEDLWE